MIETSIIIPVRNQKNSLLAALNSLRRQIKKPRDFEIVICDDDSSDGTGDTVKKLRYPIFFKYFINTPPLGRAGNRNQGVERSAGKRLIFIDGDMVPDENYITSMIGDGNLDDAKVGWALPAPEEKLNGLGRYLYSRGRYIYKDKDSHLPGRLFTSNNFMISRENFEKLSGFDMAFSGWGGEDIDFGLRLEKSGISIKNVPDALTYHYHNRTIKSLMSDFYEFGENSFVILIEKHPEFLEQIKAKLLGISPTKNPTALYYRFLSLFTVNTLSIKAAASVMSSFGNFKWPDFMYDYILWGSLALGYRKRR